MDKFFQRALANISKYGDTDVFPFPVENHVFYDRPADVVEVLEELHRNLNAALASNAPVTDRLLTAVGYTGFRWATQVDPVWNAYFLALVISIGEEIEAARLPVEREIVFSYRFEWNEDDATMFRRDIGWTEFQLKSIAEARKCTHVLACDISDFYPRIYHHRLENALQKAVGKGDTVRRIMKLLMQFSDNVSYSLPVGGPAARLLSELLLNRVDRLLCTAGVNYARFADDYHIFAQSEQEAYRQLVLLSEKLMSNEGLLLQKAKTRVMSAQEFLATSELAEENVPEGEDEKEGRDFLRLRLYFDPYSPTADEEYEKLKSELDRFDIPGMIGRELRKSRVQQSLARKLIGAVKHLEPEARDETILSLIESLDTLYPVYPSVMIMLRSTIDDVEDEVRQEVFSRIRRLIQEKSHIVQVPTNLAFTVRVLAHDTSEEAEELLARVYRETEHTAVRRDVILAMAHRNADYWISDTRRNFGIVSRWERTALLVASYILGDEGKHWRKSIAPELSPMQAVVRKWAAARAMSGVKEIPI